MACIVTTLEALGAYSTHTAGLLCSASLVPPDALLGKKTMSCCCTLDLLGLASAVLSQHPHLLFSHDVVSLVMCRAGVHASTLVWLIASAYCAGESANAPPSPLLARSQVQKTRF